MVSKWMKWVGLLVVFSATVFYLPTKVNADTNLENDTEIEMFFNDYFDEKMKEHHVPGAAFIIIKNGKLLLSKGYGYADLEKGIPVDPETTVFRMASLSKIYVILSILKLHEDGIIDLEAEVSTYLEKDDPLIERVEGIKMKHLLSHTEGFPSKDVGTFVLSLEEIPALHETLLKDLKEPNLEPGKGIAYGGIGSVLAAHLIETITGEPFHYYIENNFQQPLAMDRSTFLQDLPSELKDSLAQTYIYDEGEFQKTNYLYGVTPPSGGLSSTGTDVSNLLITIMENGTFQGTQILKPETIDLMLTPQFRGHENLPGVTYGFFEIYENNKRALVRDGSGFGVTTRMLLIPEDQLGFVYLQNIRGDELLDDLTKTFFDYFYEEKSQPTTMIPLSKKEAESIEGTYRAIQHHRNIMKIGSFLSGMIQDISANDDGTLQLVVSGPGDTAGWGGFGKETTLTQIKPLLFKRSDTGDYVAFEKSGKMILLHSGAGYHSTYQKIPWYEQALPQLVFLSVFIVIFLVASIYAIIQVIKRSEKPNIEKAYVNVAGVISFLNLAFPYPLFYFAFIKRIEGFPAVAFGIPTPVQILLYTPVITGILAFVLTGIFTKLLGRKDISKGKKIGYFTILLAAILFIPYAMYWRIFPGFA